MRFSFGVNMCVFIPMILFYSLKWSFSFSVNVYVFIPMLLFIVKK